ncbi:HYR domain protein [Kordia sp. SMS9]|uniref:HYR domain-containing protein n=1 Tax=Kordia sp. SMS9 TaxID=2282170 RepID=UPI000E0DC189|nr:HYR domain-containing protein [Kordia sp. SMS9]AXG71899.1 HYR domain protein [Kordia sp. SMS9]
MNKKLLFVLLFLTGVTTNFAQGIFDDSIHTATTFGSVNSPGGEAVQNVIDQNSNTKFLDFNAFDGIGFEVDILGVSSTAVAMEFVTANDAPERDPTNYEISGSNDGVNFTSIATGTIPCVSTRFFSRTFSFTNTTSYTSYRLNFTGTCGASSINQIADVQLFESIGDSPVITCPSNITVNNTTGQCDAIVNYTVTANDTEDGMLTPNVTSGLPSGASFPVGITEVFMNVTDTDNNTSSCSFTVTVVDNEDPVAGCPANIMQTAANFGDTTAVVNYTLSPTDNCVLINPLTDFTPLTNINGKAYYLSNNVFTPANAFLDAISQGGFVGTIRNASDNTAITEAIATAGGAADVLIGFSDTDVEGTFVWQSGDASTFDNWNPGEPNNAGNEDYTVIQSSGGWNDITNGSSYRYLLEVDYAPTQTAGLPSGADFPIGTTTNTFTITDLAGNSVMCSFDVTVDANLSVAENSFSNRIKLTPNPTKGLISFSNTANISLESIVIMDLNGRILQTVMNIGQLSDGETIDISNFAAGMYFVRLQDIENNIAVKRIIKQ